MGTLICNVQLKRFNLIPFFSQSLSDGFSLLIVSAPENHANVSADQFTCRLQSQTAVAAGDQRDASICVLHGETLASFLSSQKRIVDILKMIFSHHTLQKGTKTLTSEDSFSQKITK